MRRKNPGEGHVSPVLFDPDECEIHRSFPTVGAFLADAKWDDGTPRKVGSILLTCDAGRAKAWVHDVDGRQSAWVTANTFWGLLEAINRGLDNDSLEWRPDRKK